MSLMIKICGMRETENILEAAELKPDLMGFIFYPYSPRYAAGKLDPEILTRISRSVKKTGVFVNADFEEITGIVRKYSLDLVQLHGNETPDICLRLRETGIPVIKAFNYSRECRFQIMF